MDRLQACKTTIFYRFHNQSTQFNLRVGKKCMWSKQLAANAFFFVDVFVFDSILSYFTLEGYKDNWLSSSDFLKKVMVI